MGSTTDPLDLRANVNVFCQGIARTPQQNRTGTIMDFFGCVTLVKRPVVGEGAVV